MNAADDAVLEAIERWKKRVISAFALLSLLVAILVALTIEIGALAHTIRRELHGQPTSSQHTQRATDLAER